MRFDYLGLKKLISTSYAPNSNKSGQFYTPQESLFEGLEYDEETDFERGKIFILENDEKTGDGVVNIDDIQWEYLEGDGDFRSPEVTKLRDEADFVITNPPFSLFREFIDWVLKGDCHFSVIGSLNAATYKEFFPLIKENKVWLGYTTPTSFITPANEDGVEENKVVPSWWYTSIPHGKRYEPMSLMNMADNKRFSKSYEKFKHTYKKYDNYDAIEVPRINIIPSDYKGAMGVPISFLTKYCPEQFEILGATESEGAGFSNGLWLPDSKAKQAIVEGNRVYKRLFIKHKNPESSPENPS